MQWLIVIATLVGGDPAVIPAPAAMAAQPGGSGETLLVAAAIVPVAATLPTDPVGPAVMLTTGGGRAEGAASASPAGMAVPRRLFGSAGECEQAAGAVAPAPGLRLVCLPVEAAAADAMPTGY